MTERLEVLMERSGGKSNSVAGLAAEISEPETAKRLLKLADELEQPLREVDRE